MAYLAQYTAADLYLDTYGYNAHSTACDALWAGLPVITCPGESFAARVGASLLTNIGLSEFVMSSLTEYEETSVKYAKQPEFALCTRQKLSENRFSFPLFDTQQYVRHLEAAYEEIWSSSTQN